jgi:hypothetical protein
MEHKVNAKLPLSTALTLLEQLLTTTYVYVAKIQLNHVETECTSCRLCSIRAIKKAFSDCCPEELFNYDNRAEVTVELEYNDEVESILQAFRLPKLEYIVEVR